MSSVRKKTPEEADKQSDEMLAAINAAIKTMQTQIAGDNGVKGTLTDLIRLLQLRKDLEGERPRNISVRWIDECEN